MRKTLGVRLYKKRKIPLIMEKQWQDRLKFCRERQNWTGEDWEKVIWSDESPFEVYLSPNPKNDVVWAYSAASVPAFEKPKFSGKLMVWGAMSSKALSELHIVPSRTLIDAQYYHDIILEGFLLPALDRTATTGPLTERRFYHSMSESIFMQDNARCHTAKSTTKWLQDHGIQFLGQGIWPANSPDINPIENLWAILEEEVKSEKTQPTNLAALEKSLKRAWAKIESETLENLVKSMPDRIKSVIKAKGHFVFRK